jgi:hypothetical protein
VDSGGGNESKEGLRMHNSYFATLTCNLYKTAEESGLVLLLLRFTRSFTHTSQAGFKL